jgi:hypothetical protein
MSKAAEPLHLYLNDHLAGAIAALELLDDLIARHEAHRLASFLAELRDDVAADQQSLRELMEKVGADENALRKASAWLGEKVGRAKLRFSGESSMGLLQAFEALVLGVTGKKLLWRSLAAISSNIVELQGTDFRNLEFRAEEQTEKLESERLQISREVLSDREHS